VDFTHEMALRALSRCGNKVDSQVLGLDVLFAFRAVEGDGVRGHIGRFGERDSAAGHQPSIAYWALPWVYPGLQFIPVFTALSKTNWASKFIESLLQIAIAVTHQSLTFLHWTLC
jgi:hypothetical protein